MARWWEDEETFDRLSQEAKREMGVGSAIWEPIIPPWLQRGREYSAPEPQPGTQMGTWAEPPPSEPYGQPTWWARPPAQAAPAPQGQSSRWETYTMTPAPPIPEPGWLDVGAALPRVGFEPQWTPEDMPTWQADYRRRLQEAWERATAEREPLEIGQAIRDIARDMRAAREIEQQAATPAQLRWQGLRDPGARAALAGVGRLAGAVRHDVKQIPGIGVLPRIGEAAIGGLSATLQAPEEWLRQSVMAQPSLRGAERMAELYREDPELAELLEGSQFDAGRVWFNLEQKGYASEEIKKALREVSRFALSGPEAAEAGAERVIHGEDPDIVRFGRRVNLEDPTEADIDAYMRYVTAVYRSAKRAGLDEARARELAKRAEQELKVNRRIPGEAKIFRELVGDILLDPLNIAQAMVHGDEIIRAVERGREALGAVEEAPEIARTAERIAETAAEVPEVVRPAAQIAEEAAEITRPAMPVVQEAAPQVVEYEIPEIVADMTRRAEALQDAARVQRGARVAIENVIPERWRSWARRNWQKINPFELTPESKAFAAADDAGIVLGTLARESASAEEAVDLTRRFVDDPESLRPLVGNMVDWTSWRDARRLVQDIDLDELPSVKAAEAGAEFNPGEFIFDIQDQIIRRLAGLDEAKAGSKALLDYERWAENYRNLMSEFYLRTGGYLIRNTTGDLMTMANDGLLSLDSFETVLDDLERFGPTTRRVGEAIQAVGLGQPEAMQMGRESVLGKVVGAVLGERAGRIVSGVSEDIGEFMATGRIAGKRTVLGEESRYLKAFHTGLMKSLAVTWDPEIPQELVEALGATRTAALRGYLRRAMSTDEMIEAVRRVTSGEDVAGLFDYMRYIDEPDNLSLELVRRLDEGLRGVETPEQATAVFDDLMRQLDDDLGRVLAGDPLPPVRRMNTSAEWMQDAAEDAARQLQLAESLEVDADEAMALAERHRAEMEQMLEETQALETALMAQAGEAMEQGQDPRQLTRVLRQIRADEAEIQMNARAAVDKARQEVYERLRSLSPNLTSRQLSARKQAIWNDYYEDVRKIRNDEQVEVRSLLRGVQEQLAAGELPDIGEDVAARAVNRYRSHLEQLMQRHERLGREAVENLAQDERSFAIQLETMRLTFDEAQSEAWRAALLNPSPDALDIMAQAERDAQNIGAAAAARAEDIYQQWRATWGTSHEWTKAQFRERVDEVWRKAFREQAARMDMARHELFDLPLGEHARQTLLQTLGWPAKAAEELSPETASLVLKDRVRWDAAVGGPLIPVEQLEDWTLEGVARQLGVDVSDPRMVDAYDWQRIADEAKKNARLYRALTDEQALFWHAAMRGETPKEALEAGLRTLRGVRNLTADDPAFADRMRMAADHLEEVAESAAARAQVGTTALGEVVDVIPEGTEYVERVRVGDLYEVRLMREGKPLATAVFENPAEALREAQRIERALYKGAAVPMDYIPSGVEGAAARFGVDPSDPDEWQRLIDVAEGRAADLLRQVEKTRDPRRRAMFEEAVEAARRVRGYNPEDEAKYARGMLPKGFGLNGETRFDQPGRATGVGETTDEWYHVISISPEDAEMVREIGNEYTERLLEMAGVTNKELRGLNTQQRNRLLEEIASGQLLETPSGNIAKIGDLSPERRQRLLNNLSENMRQLAQGATSDPARALAYEWLGVAADAQARKDIARLQRAGVELTEKDIQTLLRRHDDRERLVQDVEALAATRAEALGPILPEEPDYPTESWAAFRDYVVSELEHYKHPKHVLNALRKEFGADYNPWDDFGPKKADEMWETLVKRLEPEEMPDLARGPRLFGEEDLPLWSGVAPTGRVERFAPEAVPEVAQTVLPGMGVEAQRLRGARIQPVGEKIPAGFSPSARAFVAEDYLPPEGSDQLYHVTTARDLVLEEGLRPRSETGHVGLGGGVDDQAPGLISTTFDEGAANAIADRLEVAARAARGEMTPEEIIEWFDNLTRGELTPKEIGKAAGIVGIEDDWDALMEAAHLWGGANPYKMVQNLDDALPGLYPGPSWESGMYRVGLTASAEDMAKIDPDQIEILRVAGRQGASAEHIADEFELRFRPEDVFVQARPPSHTSDSIDVLLDEVDDEIREAVRRLTARGMDTNTTVQLGIEAQKNDEVREALLSLAATDGGMFVDEVLEASRLAGHAVEPPTVGDMADVVVEQQKRMLQQIRDGMMADWGNLQAVNEEELFPWVRNQARRWVLNELRPQWNQARTIAAESARQLADRALLDYTRRRRFDNWLALVTPYHYWKTRSARNWAIRLAQQPATLASYMDYRKAMKDYREKEGLRERFEGTVPIPTGDLLPEWMGDRLFVNPESFFFPFAELAPNDWERPSEARNGIDYLYRVLNKYGFRPFGFIDAGLRAADLIGPEGLPGEGAWWRPLVDVPQGRLVQAVRTFTRPEGAGPVPALIGGYSLQDWDSYRISRMLSNMAADDPEITPDALLAQAIIARVAAGEIAPKEAVEGGPNLDRLAQVEHWPEEDVQRAQEVLRTAWLRMQQEKALPGAASALTWTGARPLPTGEERQLQLMRESRAEGYDPLTMTGSREAYEEYTREHPETYTRAVAYQMIPGREPPTEETWTPEERRGTLLYRELKPQALENLNQQQLQALRAGGMWNREGIRTLREQHTQAMTEARERLGVGEFAWPEAETTFEPMYGSSPEEVLRQAEEEVLGRISDALPRYDEYLNEEAYERAKKAFWAAIKAGNYAVAGVELPEGLPEEALEYGTRITEDDLVEYWQENDTLAEALVEAFSEWYGEQWDDYYNARGPELSEEELAEMSDEERDRYYERRDRAWQQFIEQNRVSPQDLVAWVKALYDDRWADEEIREALSELELPTTFEAWFGRRTPEEQKQYLADRELVDAKEAFWEVYWSLPEDADWRSTKGQPLVAFIIDKDTRPLATAEQYQAAAAVLRRYLEEFGEEEGEGKTTGRRTGGGGGRGRSGSRGYYRRGGGGGGRSQPRAFESWDAVKKAMSSALARQLADLFLRNTELGPGALRELRRLMEELGFTGTLEEFLEMLRELFKARKAPTSAPRGRYR